MDSGTQKTVEGTNEIVAVNVIQKHYHKNNASLY